MDHNSSIDRAGPGTTAPRTGTAPRDPNIPPRTKRWYVFHAYAGLAWLMVVAAILSGDWLFVTPNVFVAAWCLSKVYE